MWAVGGAANTILTYGLYLLFNMFMHYQVAFTASFVIGIIFAYFYNSWVVFKTPFSVRKFVQFPVVYLVQYLLSMGLLSVLVQALGVSEKFAPIVVLIIVTPVTFLLSKLILKGKNRPAGG